MSVCNCYLCTRVRAKPAQAHELVLGNDPRMMRMFLCATCGNKRCPHAADHRLACSGSNEPGQKGSLYANAPTLRSEASPLGAEPGSNANDRGREELKPLTKQPPIRERQAEGGETP